MLILTSVSACETSGPVNDFCLLDAPIFMSPEDILTYRTETQIIEHNERFEDVCGLDSVTPPE